MFDLWSIASVINFEHNRLESRALLQSIIGNFKTIQVQVYLAATGKIHSQ